MTTLFLLSDDGEYMPFHLFQRKGECEGDFIIRVFEYAEFWCPTANESHIPDEGYVRDVWDNYNMIRSMAEEDLADEIYYTASSDARYSHQIEGMFCRTWLSLLHLESRNRFKSACLHSSDPSCKSGSETELSAP